ncbi:MAG TPA: radical SAM protein [Candidatus Binataceae bacterium]|nr:radical SAM protein [Candidatus Binataceae bacterium]
MKERLRVNEVFFSIQGESTWAGCPCVFVRLTGCNLRCRWCDTEYAFYEGCHLAIEEIVERVRAYDCRLVELTGGEPLLQKDIHRLIELLLDGGFTVLIETSGERDVSQVDPRVIKIMDLKCPSSGECSGNRFNNLDCLSARDEVKFVIGDMADFHWACDMVRTYHLLDRVNAVLMSPAFGILQPAALADWILRERLPVRMQLQMHKHIWAPDTRGV